MILSLLQIQQIIKENPNRELVNKGREYNKKLRLHLYGEGLKDNLHKVEGFETEELHKLKVKYARSNRDLFSRLGRPIDKVFTAKGGSIYYNLGDSGDKQARALALNVRNGYSVRKWVEVFWKPHMLDDPHGLLFLEILPASEAQQAKQQGKSFVYPTYKSITSVYDYAPKGAELEYVVFKVDRMEKEANGIDKDWEIYRVVDDAYDYYVRKETVNGKEEVTILSAFTLPNYFGQVPAIINSDITDPAHEDCLHSFFHDALELADHFLLKGAVKLTHEFLHAYPKYWQYAPNCPKCQGHGLYESKTCPDCKGTGKYIIQNVSDALLLEFPQEGDPTVTPDVAGYVTPSKDYYDIATADLSMLEELMNVTLWGAQSNIKTQGMSTAKDGKTETATEVMNDIKPEADRLHVVSEMAEKRHKFILDGLVRLQINNGYQGSTVKYGRRYMIESPDELKAKYMEGKTAKLSTPILDNMYLQYIEAEFANDEYRLAVEKKIMATKPFFHEDAVEESMIITALDKTANRYFEEWKKTLGSEVVFLTLTEEELRQQLLDYARTKMQENTSEKEADLQLQAKYDPKQQKPAA